MVEARNGGVLGISTFSHPRFTTAPALAQPCGVRRLPVGSQQEPIGPGLVVILSLVHSTPSVKMARYIWP
jgi:hypothetical protein